MRIQLIILAFLLTSCSAEKKDPKNEALSIIGTWKLISATTIQQDTIRADDLSGKEMIKIINDSHFAFLNHDLNKGKDSTAHFVSGGGIYSLSGNQYTESLQYCNARAWEGNKFEFTVEVKGDTLIQSGIEKLEDLGIDRKIIETYLKVKN